MFSTLLKSMRHLGKLFLVGLLAVLVAVQVLALPASQANAAAVAQTLPNYSPTSRTVRPVAVHSTSGTVQNPNNVLSGTATLLQGTNSYIVLDFGKEVGGIVTLHFSAASDAGQQVGLAFSESSQYVGTASDASNGGSGADGAIYGAAVAGTNYTMPAAKLRGGFRYLTVFMSTSGWVHLDNVSLAISFAPGKANPAAYSNYFYSNDALLNQIWYAGAYTVQTNTIDPAQGRVWGPPASGWNNNAIVGVGSSVLSDGAKRDRTVWPGDMGISVPTQYVSTNDLVSTKNSLTTMYNAQQASGELPYAGPQVNFYGSDTYHLWTLLGTSSYYSYSGDLAYITSIWTKYKLGMTFITNKINGNGLLNVTGANDWARGGQGGENIAANAILYAVLVGGANLATAKGEAALASTYTSRAATLKAAANSRLWDAAQGLYRDNPASGTYPQDGNSLAVWYGLSDSSAKSLAIAQRLATRWNTYGAMTPEWGNNIGTFPGSMEVNAHFAANDDQNGLTLIRREWGYMLNSPLGTRSTFWEGFNANGTFAYGGAYMSLAHGWATGPTSALTFYVLGLAPETQLAQYRFIPHTGDLTSVEGRISMPQGAVNASWSHPNVNSFSSHLVSPAGTTGRVGVPKRGMSNVTVTANGTTVFANGASTGSVSGLSYAGSDVNYVYFSVSSGTWDFVETGGALPTTWTNCAAEGGTCSFSGTMTVRYGANGAYFYQNATGSIACTSAAFGGDPIYAVAKSCDYGSAGGPINTPTRTPTRTNTPVGPTPTPTRTATPGAGTWTLCASENATCSFSDTMVVRYGAGTSFFYRSATGSIACSNTAFGGDPIPGTVKQCHYSPQPPNNGWTLCAAENGTCSFSGTRAVGYGANGVFFYRPATTSIACTNAVFGDPTPNVAKSCYYK